MVFELGLPLEAVQRLRSLLKSNNGQLRLLRIEKVVLISRTGEVEAWILREGKFSSVSELKSEAPEAVATTGPQYVINFYGPVHDVWDELRRRARGT